MNVIYLGKHRQKGILYLFKPLGNKNETKVDEILKLSEAVEIYVNLISKGYSYDKDLSFKMTDVNKKNFTYIHAYCIK